ncbi:MAG: succinate dehydrogenase (or fumarate reductase) cytochrome b subunit, b558 family [Bacteroidota bacterium]|nr:succinate dehydrogenase (or fumarate reductase) cytochrome b subunit, b558 family [Bacteroidota bacterium]
MSAKALFSSSLGKKFLMALTGLFLISFLIVHASINGMIWFNDGGVTFNKWAHFMGTNLIIRTMEIGLFFGLVLHAVDGLLLYKQNRDARPARYLYSKYPKGITWYSRSMALLGTLILLFLIIHLSHFWVKTRFTGIEGFGVDAQGQENLFAVMVEIFKSPIVVVVYVAGCFSLFWHLLHGFKSSFQSLGLNHVKYNEVIAVLGIAFSIVVPIVFALMPITMYLGWIR